jgi:hypothetical protein
LQQVGITKIDFTKIIDVISNADKIESIGISWATGKPQLRFQKQLQSYKLFCFLSQKNCLFLLGFTFQNLFSLVGTQILEVFLFHHFILVTFLV